MLSFPVSRKPPSSFVAVVRGRTTAPSGLVLGHEITGVVEEVGKDVAFLKKGDIVSTPFNIACGRCANCVRGQTGICLTVNPARPGAAYGYVDSESVPCCLRFSIAPFNIPS